MNILCAAIIVTFHPKKEVLLKLVNQASLQLSHVIVVDNGSEDNIDEWLTDLSLGNVTIIKLGDNSGIAHAQNVGFDRARILNATHVVLFDQDSTLNDTTINCLLSAIINLHSTGKNVACVGPRYIDKRQNNPAPFVQIVGLRLTRKLCTNAMDVIPVDHLIASGSVIPMATIDIVGGMREELFIDYVDLEWCERALVMGFQAYGVCAAVMEHALGDEPIVFMGKPRPARSPLRHYYMFRNAAWIYLQPWPRSNWKFVDALRLFRKYVFYSLYAKPRRLHWWMMTKGFWHGLTGKMGRYKG